MSKTVKSAPVKPVATKDAGRVHVGGGCMRFANTKSVQDAGKVHVGGGCMRF